MIKLNEILYDLWTLIGGGVLSDDMESKIAKRNLIYWVLNQRANWIHKQIDKNQTIDQDLIQDLGCIDLELIDRAECCDVAIGCTIKRTAVDIPKFVEQRHSLAITRVGSIDKLKSGYHIIDLERVPYFSNQKFGLRQIFVFYKDRRIYLISKNNMLVNTLRKINIQGVLEDPREARGFLSCDGTPCWTYDSPFPINRWMIDYIKAEVLKLNTEYFLKMPTNVSNNASSETKLEEQQ